MLGICPSFGSFLASDSGVVPLCYSLRLALLLTWHVCATREYAILLVNISRNIGGWVEHIAAYNALICHTGTGSRHHVAFAFELNGTTFSVILAKMGDELLLIVLQMSEVLVISL